MVSGKKRRNAPKKKKGTRPKAPKAKANTIGGAAYNGGVANAPSRVNTLKGPSSSVGNRLIKQSCSIYDPFCPGAKGAKLPDGRGTRTMATRLNGYVTMAGGTASAPNSNATAFVAAGPYGYATATGVTVGNYNFGSVWNIYGQSGLLAGNCSNYRIVSFGVMARVVSAVNSTSGSIAFNTLNPEFSATQGDLVPPLSSDYEEQQTYPLATGATYLWTSKPQGTDSTQFKDQSGNNWTGKDNDQCTGFTGLVVELRGSTSSTVIEMEYFVNIEAQILPNKSMATLLPPDTPPSPVAMQARSIANKTTTASVPGTAANYEVDVVKKMGGIVGKLTAGPFGSMALALMDAL